MAYENSFKKFLLTLGEAALDLKDQESQEEM